MLTYQRGWLASDIKASLLVFLVALPLALGISLASGYPPSAGIITGIIGGIVVGLFTGCPLQVSGTAAGLTVVILQGVQTFGIQSMGVIITLAGLIQLLAALFHLGKYFQWVPKTVVKAMLAGIGVLILTAQIPVMFDQVPHGNVFANLSLIPDLLRQALSFSSSEPSYAFWIGLGSIAVLLFWTDVTPKALHFLPSPLVAILVGSVASWYWSLPINYIRVPASILGDWQFSLAPWKDLFHDSSMMLFALQIAIIASIESLLCASAVTELQKGSRVVLNKELAAQGIGNAFCGFFGALPLTGVIVRTSANISGGAKTRLSTILHGVWLLVFVMAFPQVLSFIPIASLAGLLVIIGAKLLAPKEIKLIYQNQPRSDLLVYGVTLFVIVSVNLLYGIVSGVILAVAIQQGKRLKALHAR